MIAALGDEERQVRKAAVDALMQFEAKEIEAALLQALGNANWRIRYYSAEILGNLQTKEAKPLLVKLANNDPHPGVRRTARRALENF